MNAFRKVAWHHAKFLVPAEWEATAYSIEPRVGRIEFGSRRGFEALLAWEPCRRPPDADTLLASFVREFTPRESASAGPDPASLRAEPAGRFRLVRRESPLPSLALGYAPESQRLLRWVFARGDPQRVCRPVLESFEPNAGPVREYALFGPDILLPAEYAFEHVSALPASIAMVFESSTRRRAVFRCWGLPEFVLDGQPLEGFYTRFLQSHGMRVGAVRTVESGRVQAVRAEFERKGQHELDTFMGRWWTGGEAWLWLDADAQRLHAFEQIGPSKAPPLDPREVYAAAAATPFETRPHRPQSSSQSSSTSLSSDENKDRDYDRELEKTSGSVIADSAGGARGENRSRKLDFARHLASVPMRNAGALIRPDADGRSLVAEVELRYAGLAALAARIWRPRTRRRYRIDGLGKEVFELIDGKQTFEALVETFASRHKLTFFESRNLLMQYVQTLMKHGIVLVAVPARP